MITEPYIHKGVRYNELEFSESAEIRSLPEADKRIWSRYFEVLNNKRFPKSRPVIIGRHPSTVHLLRA